MPTISTNTYRADIQPETGGLISQISVRHGGREIDLLRPAPADGGLRDGLPLFGCFPMIPFCNRLSAPQLPTDDAPVPIPVNWPSEGLAMHGTVFAKPWVLEAHSDTAVTMSTTVPDANGAQLGRASQQVTLDDAHGVKIVLSYTHGQPRGMLAGIGLHPWFAAPREEEGTSLSFAADGRFVMTERQLPKTHNAHVGDLVTLRTTADDGLDTCFTGWSGEAALSRPGAGIRLKIASESRIFHCYMAGALDAICAEPVGHVPDAANDPRFRAQGAMTPMATGETIRSVMSLSVEALDA